MTTSAYPVQQQAKIKPLTPANLRTLQAFRDFTEKYEHTPDEPSLGKVMGKSRATARQALNCLASQGMIRHTGVRIRPWVLTELGVKVLGEQDRVAHKQQKAVETEVAA